MNNIFKYNYQIWKETRQIGAWNFSLYYGACILGPIVFVVIRLIQEYILLNFTFDGLGGNFLGSFFTGLILGYTIWRINETQYDKDNKEG